MDLTIIGLFKKTYGWEFYPNFTWIDSVTAGTAVSPFGNSFVLSLGYLIVLSITIPLGYLNLGMNTFYPLLYSNLSTVDNIIIQNGNYISINYQRKLKK